MVYSKKNSSRADGLTTIGPESRRFSGTRLRAPAQFFGDHNAAQKEKAGILDSGLVDNEMVAGVRFELTTFGL